MAGEYSVTIESTGFKQFVRSGLTLALGEHLRIDFQLELGNATESVTVTTQAPLLDTSSVSTGRALTNREVMDLPVLGNNITMLSRFTPGVQVPGTTQFLVQGQVGGGSQYNAPGGVGGNEWSVDGASTNGTDRRVSIMPSPDTIDEFKIDTSNFDASTMLEEKPVRSVVISRSSAGLEASFFWSFFSSGVSSVLGLRPNGRRPAKSR